MDINHFCGWHQPTGLYWGFIIKFKWYQLWFPFLLVSHLTCFFLLIIFSSCCYFAFNNWHWLNLLVFSTMAGLFGSFKLAIALQFKIVGTVCLCYTFWCFAFQQCWHCLSLLHLLMFYLSLVSATTHTVCLQYKFGGL